MVAIKTYVDDFDSSLERTKRIRSRREIKNVNEQLLRIGGESISGDWHDNAETAARTLSYPSRICDYQQKLRLSLCVPIMHTPRRRLLRSGNHLCPDMLFLQTHAQKCS